MKTLKQQIIDIGTFADRYVLQKPLGKGGYGLVFKARDMRWPGGRDVAIKVLMPDLNGGYDEVVRERFNQEVEICIVLSNQNTIKVLDYIEHNSGNVQLLGIVMEYIDGVTLSQLIDTDNRICEFDAATILRQMLVSLKEAHDHNPQIIHRDIKPSNVMVCNDDALQIKVLDYGIAKFLGEEVDNGLTRVAGDAPPMTVANMAPEQIEDQINIQTNTSDEIITRREGPHLDLWCLGILMYRCVTGNHPVPPEVRRKGEDMTLRVAQYVINNRFRLGPFIEEPPGYEPVPYFLADIIHRLLEPNIDPQKGPTRYLSCDEVLADLDALEAREDYQAYVKNGDYLLVPLSGEDLLETGPVGDMGVTMPMDGDLLGAAIAIEDQPTGVLDPKTSVFEAIRTDRATPDEETGHYAPSKLKEDIEQSRPTLDWTAGAVQAELKRRQVNATSEVSLENILNVYGSEDEIGTAPMRIRDIRRLVAQQQEDEKQPDVVPSPELSTDTIEEVLEAPKPSRWPVIVGVLVCVLVFAGVGIKMFASQDVTPTVKVEPVAKKEVKKDEKSEIKPDPSVFNHKAENQAQLLASKLGLTARAVVLNVKENASSKRKKTRKKPKKIIAKATQPKEAPITKVDTTPKPKKEVKPQVETKPKQPKPKPKTKFVIDDVE